MCLLQAAGDKHGMPVSCSMAAVQQSRHMLIPEHMVGVRPRSNPTEDVCIQEGPASANRLTSAEKNKQHMSARVLCP